MRILVIPSWYPTEENSIAGIFIRDQVLTLATKHFVSVLFIKINSLLYPKKKTSNEFFDNGIYTLNFSIYKGFPRPFRLLYYIYLSFKGVKRIFKKCGKPDIIHAHVSFPAGYVANLIGKRYKIPLVLTEHTGPFESLLKPFIIKLLVKWAIQRSQVVIGVSKVLQSAIGKYVPNRTVQVIPNMVDTEYFKPAICQKHSGKVKVLVVALMSSIKGISYLLKAIRMIVDEGYDSFHLDLIGDGTTREEHEAESEKLKLSSYVTFHGLKNREEVRNFMQDCDFLVLPSLAETFGVVLIEAMSCGKPVVATKCGGPEDIVNKETGILVSPANVVELYKGLLYMMSNYQTYKAKAIRDYTVENYSKEKILESLNKIYSEAISFC